GGAFIPLFALAYEHSDDPSLRPFDRPVTQEQREDLIAAMIAGVNSLYRDFVERQKFSLSSALKVPKFAAKTGRNEPCPCGSGKKFKRCCGQITTYH
ncbi:MAG: SEC-C metal-binding domain-containing protein, partial [Anderseniella sp.]|nr:SEC-C metal-binding domain-containing protein [Anderseniella sp.]